MKKLNFRCHESLFAIFLELIKKINIFTYIIGSKAAFFSLSQAITPLSGILFKPNALGPIFIIRTLVTIFTANFGLCISLLYHIPTLCGALYLNPKCSQIRFLIPLICIVLFVIHPIGSQAYVYSFYWIIPILISFINKDSIFLECLGSTFTTHAVGSVLWLYTNSISSNYWLGLISLVWAERLIFATTMTLFYYAVQTIKKLEINKVSLLPISFSYKNKA